MTTCFDKPACCCAVSSTFVLQATEGNAWHADHIVAVYEGGGGCELDNLRTLCVACHAAVTKKQAAARAAERQRRRLGTADIRLWFGGLPDSSAAAGLAAGKTKAGLKRKRRARVEGAGVKFVDDLFTPEEEGGKVQARTAGAAAAAAAGAQGAAAGAGAAGAGGPKKRGRPPNKQKAAADKAGSGKPFGQIHKWVASAAAGNGSGGGIRTSRSKAAATAAAAAGAAGAELVTPHQPSKDDVIELLDDSQPGSHDSSLIPPDSAAAALHSTPRTQRRAVKRPAAAAAVEASAAGGGVAELRTVLDQFRFSQEEGSQQQGADGRGSAGPASQQQCSMEPSQQQHQQRTSQQQQQQGKKRKAADKAAAGKKRTAGRNSKQQARLDSSEEGSGSEWGDEEDSDFADGLIAAERKQLGAAEQAAGGQGGAKQAVGAAWRSRRKAAG